MTRIRETAACVRLGMLSLTKRWGTTLTTIASVGLVTLVLIAFLAMAAGFQRTIAGGGSKEVAIALQRGATAEISSVISREEAELIREAPGIARVDGQPAVSGEILTVASLPKRSDGSPASVALRGMDISGIAIRDAVKITEGRSFRAGTNEVVVGREAFQEYAGLRLGQVVRLSGNAWRIVGVFDVDGSSALSSEIWGSLPVIQAATNRGSTVQSLRVRLDSPASLAKLQRFTVADPRLTVELRPESEFFANQAKSTTDFIQRLGWPLAICMAVGALAGTLNAMYSAMAARARETATLRTIGFSRTSTFIAALFESVVICATGALLGAIVAWLVFDGFTASTLGKSFTQVVFSFDVTGGMVLKAALLAIAIGVAGGGPPAVRASRAPILDALRA